MYLSSVQCEMGCTYEDACQLMEDNKKQIEHYGSRVKERSVGFYIRKEAKNVCGTNKACLALP